MFPAVCCTPGNRGRWCVAMCEDSEVPLPALTRAERDRRCWFYTCAVSLMLLLLMQHAETEQQKHAAFPKLRPRGKGSSAAVLLSAAAGTDFGWLFAFFAAAAEMLCPPVRK